MDTSSEKKGLAGNETLQDHFISGYFLLGKPADDTKDIDYVPTLFAYKHRNNSEAQRNERRSRIDRRRLLVEAAELDKENDEREESQESAVEGLLLLQWSCKVDVQTQTPPPVRESPGAQSSVLFYHANNLLSSSRIWFYKALWQEASRRQ